MSLEIVDRACPFCFQQDKNSNLEISSKVEYSTLTESELRTIWNNVFSRKFFFSYFRCECGGLYNKEYFSIKSLNELYSGMKENIHTGDKNSDIKTKIHYISMLSPYEQFNNVLEIGADNGSLARYLMKHKIIKNIDETIPSPILEGYLDPFIHLQPELQSVRGCPYSCTFCHMSGKHFNKVNHYSFDRTIKEIEYIKYSLRIP